MHQRKKLKVPSSISALIKDISMILRRFHSYLYNYISREANSLASTVAKKGLHIDFLCVWNTSFPMDFLSIHKEVAHGVSH